MKTPKKINFWNGSRVFYPEEFQKQLREAREPKIKILVEDIIKGKSEAGGYIRDIMDELNNEFRSTPINTKQAQFLLLSRLILKKIPISKWAQRKFKALWEELEKNEELVFSDSHLREVALGKLGIGNRKDKDFDLHNIAPEIIDTKLLLKYLKQDVALLQEVAIIHVIKKMQEVGAVGFLRKLAKIIPPETRGKNDPRKPKDWEMDWLLAQYLLGFTSYRAAVPNIQKKTKAIIHRSWGEDRVRDLLMARGKKYRSEGFDKKELIEIADKSCPRIK